MTENNHDKEIKELENLLNKEGSEFNKKEIDPNFINNLKFTLKDRFEENKKKSSRRFWGLMSWYRSPAIGAVITGVIIIAVIFEANTVNKLEMIESDTQDDTGAYSIEVPAQPVENTKKQKEAEEPKPSEKIYSKSSQESDEDKNQNAESLTQPEPQPTETAATTSGAPNTPQAALLAPPNDEATFSGEPGEGNTSFTIEGWTNSLEEAEVLLKKELQKIGITVRNSFVTENSVLITFEINGENAMQIINAIESNPNNSIYTKIEDFYEYAEDQTNIEIEIILSLKSE